MYQNLLVDCVITGVGVVSCVVVSGSLDVAVVVAGGVSDNFIC